MNDANLKEIKKTLSLKNNCLDKITICQVGFEKEIISRNDLFFGNLKQEEQLKFFDIFKKVLSGKFTKNLYPLQYDKDHDEQRMELMDLVSTEFSDEDKEKTIKKIINGFDYPEKYVIIMAYGAYDIPKKATDGTVLEGSEDVYAFTLTALCPVELVKEGLVYNDKTQEFAEKMDDWAISKPVAGFLYPAFTDRQEDPSQILYYVKSEKEMFEGFAENVLGVTINKTEDEILAAFQDIVKETFGMDCNYDTVKLATDVIAENLEVAEKNGETYNLDKPEFRTVVKRAGADDEALKRFEEAYDELIGSKDKIPAATVVNKSKVLIKSDDLKMDIKAEASDLIETRVIDGKEYILVPVTNNLSLNGVTLVQTRKK